MSEQLEAFQPFVPERRRSGNRFYSEEEDNRILEATQLAEQEGIPLDAVWHKLGDEFGRSTASVTNRYYKTLKPNTENGNEDDDDDDSDDLSGGLMDRLKNIVKERNLYKNKYESMKAEYDKVVPEYEKLTKELNKIRRMLGD